MKRIQRVFLKELFNKCKNHEITPDEATQIVLDKIEKNYHVKPASFYKQKNNYENNFENNFVEQRYSNDPCVIGFDTGI
jgi:hypothetical protein